MPQFGHFEMCLKSHPKFTLKILGCLISQHKRHARQRLGDRSEFFAICQIDTPQKTFLFYKIIKPIAKAKAPNKIK